MIIERFIRKIILKKLFAIELTSLENEITEESIKKKYTPAFQKSIMYGIASVVPLLFLDTTIVVNILIPITMVVWWARFAISLSSIKKKFENFWLELTKNLFEAFTISLTLLLMLTVVSLSAFIRKPRIVEIKYLQAWKYLGLVIGILIITNIIYKMFIWAMKYDINDAMLTGQNEAAEKFYKKSLSLLHSVSASLRDKKSLEVANYYIGVAFTEIFESINISYNDKWKNDIEKSKELIKNPSISQKEADKKAIELIQQFLTYCINPIGNSSNKKIENIKEEVICIQNNTREKQEMKDTRFAVIFEEIASLIEEQWETLFKQKKKPIIM